MQFCVDDQSSEPVYRQLMQQLLIAIARGQLKPGARLPSVRSLAEELSINASTVSRCYRELELRGVLVSRVGRGMFVAVPSHPLTLAARKRLLRRQIDELLTSAIHFGMTSSELQQLITSRERRFCWPDEKSA